MILSLLLAACSPAKLPADSISNAPTDSGAPLDTADQETGTPPEDSAAPCVPTDEICNGVDDDCDGDVDEDVDGDGYAACEDCDEADPLVNPGATEVCDGIDNDCSGAPDEAWDDDGDGQSECGGDCDDADPYNGGHLPEICDDRDNDCDGLIDEGFDLDLDGARTCDGDCDDTDASVFPGAEELCDGVDNDCDPSTSEEGDLDGDGFTMCDGDCNDEAAEALPGGTEVCSDALDNDCDGYADNLPDCYSCATQGSYLVCTTSTSWSTAADLCTSFGGSLVRIDDATENAAVAGAISAATSSAAWIGLTDAATEGTWLWVDGTAPSFTGWNSGEPNDSGGEDCVHTNYSRFGGWNDINCASSYPFVCEGVP